MRGGERGWQQEGVVARGDKSCPLIYLQVFLSFKTG